MLESFYYIKPWQIEYMQAGRCKEFLLDSGAYTFMESKPSGVNWDDYVDRYADFIIRYNIQHFFELDIDSVVGLAKVEKLRQRLENRVGRKCIPVWHKSRGKQYFLDMLKEYKRVAVGGIVSKEIKPPEYKYFHWFIDQAHRAGVEIHGLGFTNLTHLRTFQWDSVDSTAWLSGSKFGMIYVFDGQMLVGYRPGAGKRRKRHYLVDDLHNATEWIKFANYMAKRG